MFVWTFWKQQYSYGLNSYQSYQSYLIMGRFVKLWSYHRYLMNLCDWFTYIGQGRCGNHPRASEVIQTHLPSSDTTQ